MSACTRVEKCIDGNLYIFEMTDLDETNCHGSSRGENSCLFGMQISHEKGTFQLLWYSRIVGVLMIEFRGNMKRQCVYQKVYLYNAEKNSTGSERVSESSWSPPGRAQGICRSEWRYLPCLGLVIDDEKKIKHKIYKQ
jgi:hypothetical protein